MNKKIMNLIMLPVMLLVGMVLITNVKADGFNVTRTITGVTNTAVNTFTYSVVADSSNPVSVTPPSSAQLSFSSTNTVSSNTVTSNASPLIAESVWLGLNYTQPGTYKFTVSESSSNNTVYPADTNTWVVTIYVTNEISGGVPTGNLTKQYIGAMKTGTTTGKKSKTESVPFTSVANMSSMTVSNTVKGSLANTNEYFKYTVTISNSVSGTTYNVSGQTSGSISYNGSNVTPSTTCSGTSCTIYLKHGQTATIGVSGSYKQIPVGITYSVTQNNTTAQGNTYTTTNKVGSAAAATGTGTGNKTINATASNNAVAFENTSNDGDTPTGIFIKLFPFLVLLVLSGIGLYTVNKNKKLEVTE